ncbi:Uu.00g008800.m01.CDS01 [Anthostomella pinea]|uniref:Uu.00g008800.m01.CDS01 n=1 Tax=Anthostomella pinea TaxID=933095 RepID=A0AAI8VRI7_9PEZI|nr:Uu.00g008800.m01.CDS01 [Anthostomella pinea]
MASAYSRDQLGQFLDYTQLPRELHHVPPSLSLLRTLHVYMLAAVPYENLSLHYNATHTIDIDPQHIFQKIVVNRRGRGGYCMENALLYNHVLRGLGFDAYTAGVRTRPRLEGVPQGDFPGWIHIISIVTLDGKKYHVDVGFGGDGATMPMPLVDGLVHRNIGTQEIRLIRDWIPTQTHRTEEHKLWIYQYRNGADKDWNSFYAFPELEFMPLDWEVVNWWTGSSPKSWQTSTVLAIKFLRRAGEDGGETIYGKRMLVNGVVKENLGGKTSVVLECKTEEERVLALEKYFDIHLSDDEKDGIKGYKTALS